MTSADGEIAPRARENDRNAHITPSWCEVGEMGFLGAIIPEEYGGRGVDYRTYGLVVEEIGRAGSSARTWSPCSPRPPLLDRPLGQRGAEEGVAAAAVLRRGARCFGVTEPTPARTPPT